MKINKAFDTVLNGNQFNKIKEEITELRTEYFAGLVRQAHEDGILFIENINRQTDKELFEAKKRDKKIFGGILIQKVVFLVGMEMIKHQIL